MLRGFVALLVAVTAWPAAASTLRRIELDADASVIAARTGRAGVLGFLGHEHGVLARGWRADVCADPADPASLRGTITVPASELRIDTEAALAAVELEESVGPEQREELQQKLTGPRYLDAGAHPEIRFEVGSARLEDHRSGVLAGTLRLVGRTGEVRIPVEVEGLATERTEVRGSFELRQTAYGIEPESVAGVVKVADAVEVRFRLVGRITRTPCDGSP